MRRKNHYFKYCIFVIYLILIEGCAKRDAMHDAILKLPNFDVSAAPPICGRWRDHMPAIRPKESYDVYIKARKKWRSKQAWLFEKEENQSILNDVVFSAEKGDCEGPSC